MGWKKIRESNLVIIFVIFHQKWRILASKWKYWNFSEFNLAVDLLKYKILKEKLRIRMRKDLMTEQNFDSKTIRYLYVSMIIAGLAFTGKFEGPSLKWTVLGQSRRSIGV